MLRARAGLISSLLLFVDVLASALVFAFVASRQELRLPSAGDAGIGSLLISGLVASLAWPLILEQLQDQIDQLHSIVETQQAVIEQHTARLAALDHPHGHDR